MKILETNFVYRLSQGEKLAWHGRYHAHNKNEYEIHFFLDGEGQFLSNTAKFPIEQYSLFLCGPQEFHSIIPKNLSKPITYYAILFSLTDETDNEIKLFIQNHLSKRTIQTIPQTNQFFFEELFRLSKSNETGLQKSSEHFLLSLLYQWYAENQTVPSQKFSERKSQQILVQNAVQYLLSHLHSHITITNVAYKFGLSAEHFIRIFRAEINMTPYQYLTRAKIAAAASEIIATNKPISTISDNFGFENQFHFARTFKKCTGLTPTFYRQCYSNSISENDSENNN